MNKSNARLSLLPSSIKSSKTTTPCLEETTATGLDDRESLRETGPRDLAWVEIGLATLHNNNALERGGGVSNNLGVLQQEFFGKHGLATPRRTHHQNTGRGMKAKRFSRLHDEREMTHTFVHFQPFY